MGQRSENRRQRIRKIVDAAGNVFAEKGFKEATIPDVAKAAEISPRLVYYYFESKDEILISLLDAHSSLWLERAPQIISEAPEDPIEAISTLVCAELEMCFETIETRDLWRNILAISTASEAFRADNRVYDSARQHSRSVETLLRNLIEKGALRPDIDVDACAWLFWSISRAAFRDYLSRKDATFDELLATIRTHISIACRGVIPNTA